MDQKKSAIGIDKEPLGFGVFLLWIQSAFKSEGNEHVTRCSLFLPANLTMNPIKTSPDFSIWIWLKIIDTPNRWFPTKYDHSCGSFGTLILSHCHIPLYTIYVSPNMFAKNVLGHESRPNKKTPKSEAIS